jgi:flavin-dependent dehydrogenase
MSFTHADRGSVHFHDFSGPSGSDHGIVVPRITLDALLLDRAREAGSDHLLGRVERFIWHGNRVHGIGMIDSSGRNAEIRSRVVVAASGSNGLALMVDRRRTQASNLWGVAARTYLTTRESFGDTLEVRLPITHRSVTLFGYGWVFPVADDLVNVGVGFACTSPGISIRKVTEEFIADWMTRDPRLAGATLSTAISVAPVAVGPRMVTTPGLIVVGDAAGLVNPFTGEGIAAALESGELAANVFADGGDEATYRSALRAQFGSRFRVQASLRALYTDGPAILGRAWDMLASNGIAGGALSAMWWDQERIADFAKRPPLTKMVCDELCLGVSRYRPMLAEIVRQALNDPRVAFGRITDSLPTSGAGVSSTLRTVLVAIEGANVIERLHAEMERGGDATWGTDTTRLILADCLTATILRRLHTLDADLAREITNLLRSRFRGAARVAPAETLDVPDPALMRLALRVAAHAGSCGS